MIITSNRTREIHDAVKRRCLYHWVGYPSAARELEILRRKVPDAGAMLSSQVVGFVQSLRGIELYKLPGIAETIEWTRALLALDAVALEPETVGNTLGVLLKYQDDIAKMQGTEAARLVERIREEARALSPVRPGGRVLESVCSSVTSHWGLPPSASRRGHRSAHCSSRRSSWT